LWAIPSKTLRNLPPYINAGDETNHADHGPNNHPGVERIERCIIVEHHWKLGPDCIGNATTHGLEYGSKFGVSASTSRGEYATPDCAKKKDKHD
jgi:hypothetical protein